MFESAHQFKNQEKPCLPFGYAINGLTHIQNILQSRSPLVSPEEINKLHQLIAQAAVGEYFLIQSGDWAESFYECDQDITYAKLEFIQQIAEFFHRKTGKSVLRVAQIERQYIKPRNNSDEVSKNKRIDSYFSNKINQFQKQSQIPELWRMLLGYNCSVCIYSEIKQWNRELKPEQKTYTSHEALSLYYEKALTRLDEQTGLHYNRSTHFLYLSNRTISSKEHIGYLKKIANPIALKIGPDTPISTVIKTINQLDPDDVPGRITLIPRLGMQQLHCILPQLIKAVKKTQRTVLWSCDPMHGNTEILSSGRKIRKLSTIVDEIKNSFLIHKTMGSQLNALHLEATYKNVMECADYTSSISELVTDFQKNDRSLARPRLNYAQAMHTIQFIANQFNNSMVP